MVEVVTRALVPCAAAVLLSVAGGCSASSRGDTSVGGEAGAGGPDAATNSDASTSGDAPSSTGGDSGTALTTDGATETGTVPGSDGGAAATLGHPSSTVVADAIAAALSSFHENTSTGDIWCTPCDGAPVLLAVASYTGNTSADARLLQQMRLLLGNGNDPFGTGGYSANDEKNATVMYAIARRTPRIWGQLTTTEVHTIDLIMEATFVADVYATADATNGSGPPRTFDGSTNSNRDWNPNYREGMIGAVIVGAEYFGGQAPSEAMLASYNHATFTQQLQTAGLTHLYQTFDTYQSNPAAGAPGPQAVQQGIVGYAMHGLTLGQLLEMYVYLASDTFSATVACGLNGGAGVDAGAVTAGRIVSGCPALPNLGKVGMEKEFNSSDANGARSDASYARLGTRADLFNQLVVVVYGDWMDTTASKTALGQLAIGVTDFFYKATQGYEDYSHGVDQGLFKCGTDMDCTLNQAIWTQVLAPAHGL
jgi:hypothetical protein